MIVKRNKWVLEIDAPQRNFIVTQTGVTLWSWDIHAKIYNDDVCQFPSFFCFDDDSVENEVARYEYPEMVPRYIRELFNHKARRMVKNARKEG